MIAIMTLIIISSLMLTIYISSSYDFMGAQNLLINSQQFKDELYLVKKSLLVLSTTYKETIDETTITYPALPLGINQGDYHTLPAQLMKPRNPFGKPYVYCPSAARSDQPMTETINNGTGRPYNVATSVLVKNGVSLPYVTSSGLNTLNGAVVLAFIISPNPPFTASTRCEDVTFDHELQKFVVAGGRVETITAIEVEAVNLNNQ
ncbi:hypothetical protein GIV75_28865 [Pseudomonas sp. PA-3-5D]|uniref:hypothetical protein n=4 Tax=unclassified Pseudomonas TaxID=196821 RepID=UPI001F16CCB5|nr:hypothetical protein [Pseudomonas sp. PA-3-5D]MCF5564848.1 hypothetical protein [Pseudomonas sp. PA-3-5D]